MKITDNQLAMMRKIDGVGILPYPNVKGRDVIKKLQAKGLVEKRTFGAMLNQKGEQELDKMNKKGR